MLEKIAAQGLQKCVSKLSRISTGEWYVVSAAVSARSMEEAVRDHASSSGQQTGAAVYFDVRGEFPFASMIVFRPGDIDTLSRGFLGFSFSKLPNLSQAQELLLSELGNIMFNSLLSALSAALGRVFIPSVPKCVQGGIPFLLEALWTSLDRSGRHSLVTVVMDLNCGDALTRCELITVIPEKMESLLAAAENGR